MTRGELQRLADEDLMPLIAREDPLAFEVFYDRHAGAAYSIAYRIVGSRIAAAAVQGVTFRVTRAAVDRLGAQGFRYFTGIWPGEKHQEESQAAKAVR